MKKSIENRERFLARLSGRQWGESLQLIEFAYDLAKEAHRPAKRTTGERYFEHPRAGCLILMDELGIYQSDILIAFLLHDVGEDTALLGNGTASYAQFVETAFFRLTRIFDTTVAHVVIALTKPWVDNIQFFNKEEAYAYYIAHLAESEYALLCKAVDRLHNLRTLPLNDRAKIKNQIAETETIYLPLFASVTGTYQTFMGHLIVAINKELQVLKASLTD